ncbi:glycosyltransferase [Poriferisphaera sp. WC338]|uniref:glycosyltransferase n=1 Tax=Poriferisphaera sp. WC338 TaxID=3425129 RepID=UPI003D8146C0
MSMHLPLIGHVLHQMDFAGAEVLAADLARRLGHRWRFVFLCLDGVGVLGDQLRDEGYEVVDLGRRPGVDWRVGRRLRKVVHERHIHLLHAHQYTPFFYAAVSRRFKAHPPIVFTEHGRHYPDKRSGKRVFVNQYLLKEHDRVTAVGQFVRQALIENEGITEQRTGKTVEVIYNGIDPDKFGAGDKAEARRRLGLGEHERIIMQVARFHPVKDHETAVRAFARAIGDEPEVLGSKANRAKLVLVGDGSEREMIEALVQELEIGEHVLFTGVRDDVHEILPAADIFMLSSLSEGVSVTLLEAMAANIPIAATNVGGNAEVVEHGRNGLLSERQHPEALAHNLKMLLGDADMRAKMGEAGQNRLLKMFTQHQMHKAYERVYAQMLGEPMQREMV